jgi:hypothetical protein
MTMKCGGLAPKRHTTKWLEDFLELNECCALVSHGQLADMGRSRFVIYPRGARERFYRELHADAWKVTSEAIDAYGAEPWRTDWPVVAPLIPMNSWRGLQGWTVDSTAPPCARCKKQQGLDEFRRIGEHPLCYVCRDIVSFSVAEAIHGALNVLMVLSAEGSLLFDVRCTVSSFSYRLLLRQ